MKRFSLRGGEKVKKLSMGESSPTAREEESRSRKHQLPCAFLFRRRLALPRRRTHAGALYRGLRALGTSSKRQKGARERGHLGLVARERRWCSASATTAVERKKSEEGIGCPRCRGENGNGGAPSPFPPFVALLPLRARRARRGGCVLQRGESSEQ